MQTLPFDKLYTVLSNILISGPPCGTSDDSECWLQRRCDTGSKCILSESLDVLLGICNTIMAMPYVRFYLVKLMLCTQLWKAFKVKVLSPLQQRLIWQYDMKKQNSKTNEEEETW